MAKKTTAAPAPESEPFAEIVGGFLILRVPLQTPTRSASGKTFVVATTHGNKTLHDVLVDGKPVVVGVNAYVRA